LLPAVAQNSAWSSIDVAAVKAFQKAQQAPQTGVVDKSTYESLMKKLP
jgi:murein L,D-transpeptidase YcbB/YkuD